LRTFVSGLNGNDSNTASNCPHTAPCRTLAAAITVTLPGGEVTALDPAGYAPFTTNSSVILTGVPGAAINVASGQTGIIVNATGIIVTVNNFEITGNGASNTVGISGNVGSNLLLRNSVLKLLTTGLFVSGKVDLIDTDILFNTTGILTVGP